MYVCMCVYVYVCMCVCVYVDDMRKKKVFDQGKVYTRYDVGSDKGQEDVIQGVHVCVFCMSMCVCVCVYACMQVGE